MSDPRAGEVVGRVGRPHGRDGSFYLDHLRGSLEHQATLVVGGCERRIERRAGTDARPILRLDGIVDRDSAAALRGERLRRSEPAEPPAGEDEWAVEELVGCRVPGLGEVRRVLAAPSCDLLEIGEEGVLVPLVRDAIQEIDTAGRRIEVDRGFLGLRGRDGDGEAGIDGTAGVPAEVPSAGEDR
jgi:16S rRNA processing protein RimM